MRWPRPFADRVAAVGALDDPVRRALLDLVAAAEGPVGRDEAARALGVSRRTAALHLDRLAEKGLLDVEYRRLTGRTGPGAGRPSKLYRRSPEEVEVSVPERHYDVAGEIIAAGVEESTRTGQPVREVVLRLACEAGRELGARSDTFENALTDLGFEPRPDGDGGIVLANCPFHRLAQRHTDTVCSLNLELLRGAAESTGRHHAVVLDPGPRRCCVRAVPAEE
jgi:predicted ArsR family transcriptional regulator